jgi:hypothetical protein
MSVPTGTIQNRCIECDWVWRVMDLHGCKVPSTQY